MKDAKEPPQIGVAHCLSCGARLMCGHLIEDGFQQCSRCKKYWIVNMTATKLIVEEAPPHLLRP